ncbi:MAG: hypothetical protein KDC44_15470, partial [Phaeodactylibacter sp.]|nr:hypothetical protein [Phaeodactylibacter sp.]
MRTHSMSKYIRFLSMLLAGFAISSGTSAQVVQHIYDDKHQLIEVHYEDGTTIQYCYDELGNRSCETVSPNTTVTADLALSGESVAPTVVCQNATLNLQWQVDNLGSGSGSGFHTVVALSADTIYEAGIDPLLLTRFQGGLEAGGLHHYSEAVSLPGGTLPGIYYLLLIVDPEDQVEELSEQNNRKYLVLTVSSNGGFTLNLSTSDASCAQNNGSATATPVGGTGPFSYTWSSTPTQTASTASGLSSGSYFVTVADAEGCETTDLALIENSQTEPAPSFN